MSRMLVRFNPVNITEKSVISRSRKPGLRRNIYSAANETHATTEANDDFGITLKLFYKENDHGC